MLQNLGCNSSSTLWVSYVRVLDSSQDGVHADAVGRALMHGVFTSAPLLTHVMLAGPEDPQGIGLGGLFAAAMINAGSHQLYVCRRQTVLPPLQAGMRAA